MRRLPQSLGLVAACVLGIGFCAGFGPGVATVSAAEEAPTAEGKAFFETKIRPVLVKQCYACHSAESTSVKGGLTLDTRAGIRKGGETGPAVVPGDVKKSLLISAIQHRDFEMPPKGKLEAGVVADFVKWVEMGAPDPRDGAVATGPRKIDVEEGRQFWCFRPVTDSAPPVVKNAAWSSSSIDRFLLARLEQAGLRPSPDADRATLIRRLAYDLTGLPPTPAEIDAFVADKSPGAYEKLVDRLLAAPQFGETWGRHWLDVARYAESNGNARNGTFPHAWRYRDWVIDALNADVPYDRFVRMQVAGDLLPASSPAERNANLTATGFLALTSKVNAKGDEFRMEFVADQIEVTTRAFLGLSVACARCHDHKFDPIPTTDYYAMAGIFLSTSPLYGGGASVGMGAAPPTDLHTLQPVDVDPQELARIQQGIADRQAQRIEVSAQLKSLGTTVADAGTAKNDPPKNGKKANNNNNNKNNKKNNNKKKNKQDDGDVDAKPGRNKPDDARSASVATGPQAAALAATLQRLDAEIDALRAKIPAAGEAMGVRDTDKPVDTPVFLRGESRSGSAVPRNVVQVATVGPLPRIAPDRSGRLELAEWLTDPRQPLTSRVMVNRVWQQVFGRGIVATPDNFGRSGAAPTHPELLDWLAVDFVDSGWRLKPLLRQILLSSVYRQSSVNSAALSVSADESRTETLAPPTPTLPPPGGEGDLPRMSAHPQSAIPHPQSANPQSIDPENHLLWRMPLRRLESEIIRDALLAVSGALDARIGGPPTPVKPLPDGMVIVETENLPPGTTPFRRSLYLVSRRNYQPTELSVFDQPLVATNCTRRTSAAVALQSLTMLNGRFAAEQAERFAARVAGDAGDEDVLRIELAFRLSLSRPPTAEELELSRALLATQRARAAAQPHTTAAQANAQALTHLCHMLLNTNEFLYVP